MLTSTPPNTNHYYPNHDVGFSTEILRTRETIYDNDTVGSTSHLVDTDPKNVERSPATPLSSPPESFPQGRTSGATERSEQDDTAIGHLLEDPFASLAPSFPTHNWSLMENPTFIPEPRFTIDCNDGTEPTDLVGEYIDQPGLGAMIQNSRKRKSTALVGRQKRRRGPISPDGSPQYWCPHPECKETRTSRTRMENHMHNDHEVRNAMPHQAPSQETEGYDDASPRHKARRPRSSLPRPLIPAFCLQCRLTLDSWDHSWTHFMSDQEGGMTLAEYQYIRCHSPQMYDPEKGLVDNNSYAPEGVPWALGATAATSFD